jgi:hypothetical protein
MKSTAFIPLGGVLALATTSMGLGFLGQPVLAKTFWDQTIVVKADPGPPTISPEETFRFDLVTEDTLTTITRPGYTNPGVVTPTNPIDPTATRTDANPLLTSHPYTFTGYKVLQILNGKRYQGGIYDGDIKFRESGAYAGTNAEDVGVFNYAYGAYPNPTPPPADFPLYPTDLIAHAQPDNLWNPRGEGSGFTFTPSLPARALDNYVSFGGIAFDVFKAGTIEFDEPYQIFTISQKITSGNYTDFGVGDYAGCPGSCRGAIINAPAPLPLLGIGAAFGYSRRLRKRIKPNQSAKLITTMT